MRSLVLSVVVLSVASSPARARPADVLAVKGALAKYGAAYAAKLASPDATAMAGLITSFIYSSADFQQCTQGKEERCMAFEHAYMAMFRREYDRRDSAIKAQLDAAWKELQRVVNTLKGPAKASVQATIDGLRNAAGSAHLRFLQLFSKNEERDFNACGLSTNDPKLMTPGQYVCYRRIDIASFRSYQPEAALRATRFFLQALDSAEQQLDEDLGPAAPAHGPATPADFQSGPFTYREAMSYYHQATARPTTGDVENTAWVMVGAAVPHDDVAEILGESYGFRDDFDASGLTLHGLSMAGDLTSVRAEIRFQHYAPWYKGALTVSQSGLDGTYGEKVDSNNGFATWRDRSDQLCKLTDSWGLDTDCVYADAAKDRLICPEGLVVDTTTSAFLSKYNQKVIAIVEYRSIPASESKITLPAP